MIANAMLCAQNDEFDKFIEHWIHTCLHKKQSQSSVFFVQQNWLTISIFVVWFWVMNQTKWNFENVAQFYLVYRKLLQVQEYLLPLLKKRHQKFSGVNNVQLAKWLISVLRLGLFKINAQNTSSFILWCFTWHWLLFILIHLISSKNWFMMDFLVGQWNKINETIYIVDVFSPSSPPRTWHLFRKLSQHFLWIWWDCWLWKHLFAINYFTMKFK